VVTKCSVDVLPLRYGDFADLAGGRPWEDLGPASWGAPRHLYEGDSEGRDALEILLVKLSAFAELCRSLRGPSGREDVPAFRIGPDDVWIDLLPNSVVIPGLWSFSLRLPEPEADGIGDAADLARLGAMLARALLANRRQSTEAVVDAAKDREAYAGPTLQPENLFYEPQERIAVAVPMPLWRRVQRLTVGLCRGEGTPDTALRDVLQELEGIRADLRQTLFFDPPGTDREVLSVLLDLVGDPEWVRAVGAGAVPEAPAQRPVSPPPPVQPVLAGPPEPEPVSETVSLDETIILGPGGLEPARRSASAPPPEAPRPAPGAGPGEGQSEEGLEETIILRPAAPRKSP
jgi:hypothetical protein